MKLRSVLAATALAATAAVAVPASASAKPDTDCMRAGIAFLKGAGLFSSAAKDGLSVATAVGAGVTVRSGDGSGLPDVLPLSVVLADHRAGENSIFVYPWEEGTACAQ